MRKIAQYRHYLICLTLILSGLAFPLISSSYLHASEVQDHLISEDLRAEKLSIMSNGQYYCHISQWNSYIDGTSSPMPSCFATVISNKTDVAFPSLVGTADANGQSKIVNDQTNISFAQAVIQAETEKGNKSQESGLAINFISRTGGGGLPQTCCNEKVALYVPTLQVKGGSNTWAFNPDLTILNGVGNYSSFVEELDLVNFNKDAIPGAPDAPLIASTFRSFLGRPVTAGELWGGTADPGDFSMHDGFLIQGASLIKDNTFLDSTSSNISVNVMGHHTVAFASSNGNNRYAFVSGAKQFSCLDGVVLDACWSYQGENALQYQQHGSIAFQIITPPEPNSTNGIVVRSAPKGEGPAIMATPTVGPDKAVALNISAFGDAAVKVQSKLVANKGLNVTNDGVRLAAVKVADLPLCDNGSASLFMVVGDALDVTYRGVVRGGGYDVNPVFCDGKDWRYH